MIPVAPNDVAFSIHAVLLTAVTLFQIAIYEVSVCFCWVFVLLEDVCASVGWLGVNVFEFIAISVQRGSQKISKTAVSIASVIWLAAAVCFFVALPHHSWLWLINVFK